MTVICPKCQHVRADDATVPSWQCPACGVAYSKASPSANGIGSISPPTSSPHLSLKADSSLPWGKIVLGIVLICGVWFGHRASQSQRSGDGGMASIAARFGSSTSESDIRVLATNVKAGDVTMFTTTGCPYCAEAKGWLTQNGFAFTECNAEVRRECADEMQARKAKGVPFLIVKGKPMNDGFDSDEFIALLAQR